MGADGGFVEGIDTQAEVVHVSGLGPWRTAAFPAQFTGDIDQVNEGPAGTKLNQPQIVLAALYRAAQNVLVKPDHPLHVNHAKDHMIDTLYSESHPLTP